MGPVGTYGENPDNMVEICARLSLGRQPWLAFWNPRGRAWNLEDDVPITWLPSGPACALIPASISGRNKCLDHLPPQARKQVTERHLLLTGESSSPLGHSYQRHWQRQGSEKRARGGRGQAPQLWEGGNSPEHSSGPPSPPHCTLATVYQLLWTRLRRTGRDSQRLLHTVHSPSRGSPTTQFLVLWSEKPAQAPRKQKAHPILDQGHDLLDCVTFGLSPVEARSSDSRWTAWHKGIPESIPRFDISSSATCDYPQRPSTWTPLSFC